MSAGGGTVAAEAAPQLYFCHKCNRSVSITPLPNADLICPTCNSGFLEELENPPTPTPNPNPSFVQNPLFSAFFGGGPTQDPFDDLFGSSFSARGSGGPAAADAFNPVAYLQDQFNSRRTRGAEFRIIINGHSFSGGDQGFGLPANFGDYFLGQGFEQLIQQLAENDPNRYGTPPAAKSAVESLPTIKVDDNLLKSELAQCAVCKDDFDRDMEVKQMPCKHVYHPDCILPWLELHNSCPVCRYELPTDDPDYQRSNPAAGSGNSNDDGGSGGGAQAAGARRSFNISLNWPFRRGGGGGDGSSSGNNGGESNSGSQESGGWN